MKKINGIIMQYFEWYMDCKQNLWNQVKENAEKLADLGVTAMWLPPAYKGVGGKDEVGYGVYDLYDLGEFDQKGTIKTKYGSKDEYLEAIIALKQAGIESYADIVLNHKMGADLDFSNPRVVKECTDWGKWYLDLTKVDGFRLDAVKHIDADFYKKWIQTLRDESKKELFAVGEYWAADVNKLHRYITSTEGKISLFDVPLHYNFYNASNDPNYDMSKILEHTLVKENPCMAVTFVDNHDTQPGQALQSFIQGWFKSIAYSIILLRNDGYPCVFYGDYYGIEHDNIEPVNDLKTLMLIRKDRSYGLQHDYFDHNNYIGWTQEGDDEHINSSLAVVISNAGDGYKRMYIGPQNIGETYIDGLGNCEEEVTIDEDGCGNFGVKSRSVSVWIKK